MTWDVLHVDLRTNPAEVGSGAEGAYVVFWWGNVPIGARAFLKEQLPLRRGRLVPLASELVAQQLAARHPSLGEPPRSSADGEPQFEIDAMAVAKFDDHDAMNRVGVDPASAPSGLSIIVCTRNRPGDLRRCLHSLSALSPPPLELIVVDNSADRSALSVCSEFEAARYVHEPRPGLSAARNAGVKASRGSLLAFTDDDVEVPARWALELADAFARYPQADAVTGIVIPASLATPAQRFFQFQMGGFGSCYVPLRFDRTFFEAHLARGPQVWRIGAGANMAFRRAVFDRHGPFDERLGAGASGCSEDSEYWYRILASGGCCIYEPRAVVFHHHRADWEGLRRQMRAYMKGHVSALVAQGDRHRHRGNFRRIRSQLPRYLWRTAKTSIQMGAWTRAQILFEEAVGWAAGLQYLLRWRWRASGRAAAGKAYLAG